MADDSRMGRKRQRGDMVPCPLCARDAFVHTTRLIAVPRRRVRYYRCSACGHNFKIAT